MKYHRRVFLDPSETHGAGAVLGRGVLVPAGALGPQVPVPVTVTVAPRVHRRHKFPCSGLLPASISKKLEEDQFGLNYRTTNMFVENPVYSFIGLLILFTAI